ncbi:sodium:solute symporter family protein [Chitinophaga sp. GbtcB8]|uniref:sodium:solute symporter family protein n=1 Tax=Chitinophaga sp. GbtcB8 TaxID=2824753 RepID=UPI001C2F4275|nr:sodium:solute symporter family protein [Chitinophaga sp. GbtcB8]
MKLATIDLIIILVYLLATIAIGVILKKRAKASKDAYMLGGKSLPWYLLGLSNASDMFDISGTMWMVTLAFVYGLKSIWFPWLWPSFNQVFMMVYLSAWLRRSNVTTGAEWISTRFGKGRGTSLSHTIVVIFALISCLGFLAYGFIGLGKFVEIFVPWQVVQPYVPFTVSAQYVPHFYGIVFTLFAVFYAVMGGMTSVVWADVLKYLIMSVAAVTIAIIAYRNLAGRQLPVPDGWHTPFFNWRLQLDWSQQIREVNEKIKSDGFSLFGIFFMMMVFKGILASLAGPAPNYDMQKILSTRSPKEASMMSGIVSVVLIPVRYAMIIGFAVLALLYYNQLNLSTPQGIDFEKILPSAISNFVPVGLTGLLLAGLLAAFMGTFAGTLNAAQAYIVNDIYLKYLQPNAANRSITAMNYLSGILVTLVSIVLGLFARDVNSILQWIVSALYGGYVAANVLKWHWWRFNGSGFFWGMLAGIVPALIFPQLFPHTLGLYYFPLIFLISVAGCILGTYAAPATDMDTLKHFYRTVKPWGFWGPVQAQVMADDPGFRPNKRFGTDMFNVLLGITAQICLTLLPIYAVLSMRLPLAVTVIILVIVCITLRKTWWKHLDEQNI